MITFWRSCQRLMDRVLLQIDLVDVISFIWNLFYNIFFNFFDGVGSRIDHHVGRIYTWTSNFRLGNFINSVYSLFWGFFASDLPTNVLPDEDTCYLKSWILWCQWLLVLTSLVGGGSLGTRKNVLTPLNRSWSLYFIRTKWLKAISPGPPC